MKTFTSFLLIAGAVTIGFGQELARRPLLGVQLLRVDEDTKRVMGLPDTKGVLVKTIIPNSTAEKAGFKTGDVLLKLNDTEVNTPDAAIKLVASHSGGQNFSYELIRDKKVIRGASVFQPMPTEKHEGIEMIYSSVKTVNGNQRLIISKSPGRKKYPAVVFIGGIGCYSLDFPMEPDRSEVQLLNKLTRDGYVCVRAEKPGVGDNIKCTPCKDVSFNNELEGYISAVRALKKYDYIDSNRIYIIGHSMGGVMAPVIAQHTSIRGIIAYGTIGSSFIEYLAKTRRTIAEAYNMDPVETDELIKDYCECAGYYFVEGLSTEEAAKKKNACAEYLSIFDLRSPAYNKELYNLNIPGAWKSYKGKALLLWGESDYVASREDHEIIANTVNHYHKGNGTYMSIPSSTHGMTMAGSFQDALNDPSGKFNTEVGNKIINWLKNT